MAILQVNGLTKRFGGVTAVSDVSFSVEEGRILALIGPNGAGKTTCFNMIAGAFAPTEGQVHFKGKDVTNFKSYQLNALGMARTFQVVKPMAKLSVFENLMVACLAKSRNIRQARQKAQVVLERTHLENLAEHLAGQLSIGNLKRLEVARALATEPDLLLMDEPMGGLTPPEVTQAIELIKSIRDQGVTIVLIEHIMKAVTAVADDIVVLCNGEIIANGKPDVVLKNHAVIKAYLGEGYVASH
ncbi:ABC transporter ATP-binding protein [Orrella sp. 11846]|uniref:ABC transporter ATP-binding protein n=1 Tax=Orrella sp. 11846 TaxID=3409913 RepID=UPI003B5B4A58